MLQRLFIWRLSIEQPELIKLGIDTMVLDNDDALKREGVDPTYKKVKGFQPLQMYWGRYYHRYYISKWQSPQQPWQPRISHCKEHGEAY